MRQFNLPKKLTLTIRVWASIGLMLIAACLSLTPMLTLHTDRNADRINAGIEQILSDTLPSEAAESHEEIKREVLEEFHVPERVDVSVIKLAKSVLLMGRVRQVTSNTVMHEDLTEARERLVETLASEEGRETVVIALAVSSTVSASFKGNVTGDGAFFANLLTVAVTVIALFTVLIMTAVLPVRLAVMLILSTVQALIHLLKPEKAVAKIARRLPRMLMLPLLLMLCQCVIPEISCGVGVIGVFATVVASAVLGAVISRLSSYEPVLLRYMNVMQATSAVGLVGYGLFLAGLLNTNIFYSFLQGKIGSSVAAAVVDAVRKQTVNHGYLIDLVLMIAYLAFVFLSTVYLARCIQRIARMPAWRGKSEKKKKLPRDCYLVWGLLMLPVYLIPTYVAGQKHYFADLASTEKVGDASFLVLNGEERSALNLVLVGILVILLSEIVLMILKRTLCKLPKMADGESIEEPKDEPIDETVEGSTQEPTEEFIEEHIEERIEEHIEETVAESTEEPIGETLAESAEKADPEEECRDGQPSENGGADGTADEAVNESLNEATAEAADEATDEAADEAIGEASEEEPAAAFSAE